MSMSLFLCASFVQCVSVLKRLDLSEEHKIYESHSEITLILAKKHQYNCCNKMQLCVVLKDIAMAEDYFRLLASSSPVQNLVRFIALTLSDLKCLFKVI